MKISKSIGKGKYKEIRFNTSPVGSFKLGTLQVGNASSRKLQVEEIQLGKVRNTPTLNGANKEIEPEPPEAVAVGRRQVSSCDKTN